VSPSLVGLEVFRVGSGVGVDVGNGLNDGIDVGVMVVVEEHELYNSKMRATRIIENNGIS
jgi:hypothetical protein